MMRLSWIFSTDVRWRHCQDRTWRAWAMAACHMSPGQRTARPSTRAANTMMDLTTDLFWHGPMRAKESGALFQLEEIQSRALRLYRTAGFWLLRQTRSWRYWGLMADLAGRTPRPKQTFEINSIPWQCRQTARSSISDL